MALTPKELANGQLPNAKTTLYTVPALTTVLFLPMVMVNTGAADVTVNIYKKKSGGTSRRMLDEDYTIPATGMVRVKLGVGEAACEIEGDASSATTVDYVIDGVTKT